MPIFALGDIGNLEDGLTECGDQLLGVVDADALDHAAAQVALGAGQAGRRRHLEERRPELQTVVAMVVPPAPRMDGLAGLDHRRGADQRHQLAPAPRLDPEHAEAGVCVVKGHPLDQPS